MVEPSLSTMIMTMTCFVVRFPVPRRQCGVAKHWVLFTVPVALFLTAPSCGGEDATRPRASSPTTDGNVASAASGGGCVEPDNCTLAEAGATADVLVGTAGKWSSPERIALQGTQFSALTNENELLWSVVHPEPDTWQWSSADRVVDFAVEHDQELTAAHFLWDPPALTQVLPDWVRAVTDPDGLRAVQRDHLAALADRYGGNVDRLNVINEPLTVDGTLEPRNHFHRVLGPDYITEAFTLADEVWPQAQLVLNENLVEYLPAKADGLLALARDLVAQGVPIDGIGLQMHLFAGEPDWATLENLMTDLDALGLDVAITELDVPLLNPDETLEMQAERARRVVETCLAVPACSSITFWGFDDGDTWLDSFLRPGTRPLTYDQDLRPKPMYHAVRYALLAGRPLAHERGTCRVSATASQPHVTGRSVEAGSAPTIQPVLRRTRADRQ